MAISKISSAVFIAKSSWAPTGDGAVQAHWEPNTDVYVAEEGLVIKVELAGMRSENLEITIEGQRLRIRGERPDVCRAPKCKFLVMSINYGPFESILDLPTGYDLGQARAVYLNGFLRIDVPRGAPKRAVRVRDSVSAAG
jgi:HSP20 family protein